MAQNKPRYVPTFRAPSAYEEEMLRAQRQQQLAEMLRQQAFTPDEEPYTFQGFRATPSPANAIARVLSAYTSKKLGEKAKEAEGKARQVDLEAFETLRRDLGPQTRVAAPDMFGDPMEMGGKYTPPVTETVMPTYQQREETLTRALASGTPMAQRYAQLMLSRQPQVGIEAIMEATPESRKAYQETGDPFALAKPPKAADLPSDVQSYQFYVQQEERAGRPAKSFEAFKTAQRPTTNINIPGQKTVDAYTTELSKGMAAQDLASIAAGDQAIPQIEMSYTVRDLLKQNPITGTGAQARLGLEKALVAAGFSQGDRASVTENLMAVLAKTTLAAIPTSGLGSGSGFTESDRGFLERAAAGQKEMTNANLQFLAELNEKVARANLAKSNATRKRVREMPDFARIPGALPDIIAPPVYGTRLPPGATLDR
jgi:hypothetical protein